MPKFVSGSSGHIYAHDKARGTKSKDELDEVIAAASSAKSTDQDVAKKPSAINKKGTKEKQKNSLDLFKEELKRLTEEREEQRNKLLRKSLGETPDTEASCISSPPTQQAAIPLKPDPRCPTSLTLQVNLNPKDATGSLDTGDPTTTNLYLGNLNPTVNENDLCDIFGKFGPLASIKVMWPRTDEERARKRNSGFVAYMSRIDAERAIRTLNGRELKDYELKLGWGKAVPIPQNPVYVPPELKKLVEPPPQSGMPFNAQLHESDIKRGYQVPNPYPRRLPTELETQVESSPDLANIKNTYDEFVQVLERSMVRVVQPHDRALLDRIHRTIEYVIKEGPVFEAIIIAREQANPAYSFLTDNQSPEHTYYRWKLYSILHGDDLYMWRTEEFKMFAGGPTWKPPPLNPFAGGMPIELIEKTTGIHKDVLLSGEGDFDSLMKPKHVPAFSELDLSRCSDNSRPKGSLGRLKRDQLGDLLRNLEPTKTKVGKAMLFCINHADAAQEIIECVCESLRLLDTPFQRKIARLYLISDILHNCSAPVTNASFYRKGFQVKLSSLFENLREYLVNLEDRQKADMFKQKTLQVLGAWKEWTLYEDDFIIGLSNQLLGIRSDRTSISSQPEKYTDDDRLQTAATELHPADTSVQVDKAKTSSVENLDGRPLDEATLVQCLESKGLSLRWYMTLELSDDEEGASSDESERNRSTKSASPSVARTKSKDDDTLALQRIKFKSSKWETVDPSEVAEQVVTLSKWEAPEAPKSAPVEASAGDDNQQLDLPCAEKEDNSDEKALDSQEARQDVDLSGEVGGE